MLRDDAGARVRKVKAGVYKILVRDRSADHDFHLDGPGVQKTTEVAGTGRLTWPVGLARGKVDRYRCDPDWDFMNGSLRAF